MDHTVKLPDDALAGILARLCPPDIARSCCVRRAWRAVVDGRRILLPYLLPHSVEGIFTSYTDCYRPHYLARPSTQHPGIDYGNLHFLPDYVDDYGTVVISDHCNGLLLYRDTRGFCVVNPATRQWERLPHIMRGHHTEFCNAYLAFDPTVSLHYQVFLIPSKELGLFDLTDCEQSEVPPEQLVEKNFTLSCTSLSKVPWSTEVPQHSEEWPPHVLTLEVFSSTTGRWKERSFAREGSATTRVVNARGSLRLLIGDIWNLEPRWRYSVYCHGALHVLLLRGTFVTRLSSNGKYQVIKTPIDAKEGKVGENYLGILGKDVYFAKIHHRIRIWIMSESSGQVDWVPKSNIGLEPMANISSLSPKGICIPWILDNDEVLDEYGDNKMLAGRNFDWDLDDDNNILDTNDGPRDRHKHFKLLGFHPYKEVAFFLVERFKAVAYHLDSSKVQYIGYLRPTPYSNLYMAMGEAFLYTPCMIGDIKENSYEIRE